MKYIVIPTERGFITDPPARASADAAGFDLRACIDGPVTLSHGETVVIPLGVALEIPKGHVGIMASRSGLGVKHGVYLANGIGVIDADYRGQVHAALCKRGGGSYTIEPNERVCQLLIIPVALCDAQLVESLPDTVRASGGFGSTGRR